MIHPLQQAWQSLHGLLQTPSSARELQSGIRQLIKTVEQHPYPAFALFNHTGFADGQGRAVYYHCLLTITLGKRKHWHEEVLIDALFGIISRYKASLDAHRAWLAQRSLTQEHQRSISRHSKQPHNRVAKAIAGQALHNWLTPQTSSNASPLVGQVAACGLVANQLARHQTRFTQTKLLSSLVAVRWLHDTLNTLLAVPQTLQIGSHWFDLRQREVMILSVQSEQLVVTEVSAETNKAVSLPATALSMQQLASEKGWEVLDYWQDEWQQIRTTEEATLLPASPARLKPPAALRQFKQRLEDPQPDVSALLKTLKNETATLDYLRTSASQLARENVLITENKHAFMMHGFERAFAKVSLETLIRALSLNSFPLFDTCLQRARVRSDFAAAIAKRCIPHEVAEAITLLSYLGSSGLFVHPSLRLTLTLPQHTESVFTLRSWAESGKEPEIYSLEIARRWGVNEQYLAAISLSGKSPLPAATNPATLKLAAMLQLSNYLTSHLFSNGGLLKEDQDKFHSLLSILDLQAEGVPKVIQQVIEQGNVYNLIS